MTVDSLIVNEWPNPRALVLSAPPESLGGQRVLVVGLGRFGGGVGVTKWLAGQGAHVTVTDTAAPDSLAESVAAVTHPNVTLHLGGHDPADLDGTDLVVINPAVVKRRSALFAEVQRRHLPWTTEINLFCERCKAVVVGITGTHGKSTTCAMLAAVVQAAIDADRCAYTGVHLGGNIGVSLLGRLEDMTPGDLVVLELSDAQLEDLPRIDWVPKVAVITNVTPNHIDRHGSFAAYVNAKLNIVRGSSGKNTVVVGKLSDDVQAMLDDAMTNGAARTVRVREEGADSIDLRVVGRHNLLNAACVLTICRQLGVDDGVARDALRRFTGLPHRIEWVRALDGVDYYNDSKSTSPLATVTALGCFTRPVIAIVGGKAKGAPLDACADALARAGRAVVCVGESGGAFAAALRKVATTIACPVVIEANDLADAVHAARRQAVAGDVVLLSPGAPSFDAYPNYEHRGHHFTTLVRDL